VSPSEGLTDAPRRESWPTPEDGYKPLWSIGEPLSDDEVRELVYEPTRRGWVLIPRWKR
jgi:hypothetical protein